MSPGDTKTARGARGPRRQAGRRAGALAVVLALCACDDHSAYLRREPAEHLWGTFGEEVYRLVLRSASESGPDGPARGRALASRREPFVSALDLAVPPALYEPARGGLSETLDRVDDGTLPRLTRGAADLLGELSEDRESLAAALALRDQPWTASRLELYDLARHLASAEDEAGRPVFAPLVGRALAIGREHDGLDDGGEPRLDEPQELRELARALALELRRLELEDADRAHPLGDSLAERLLGAMGIADPRGPLWVVLADPRGLPRVRIDPARGTVYRPFVDADGDRLADLDQDGDPVGATGEPVSIPAYGRGEGHATDGRALAHDGQPIFEYVDFSRSAYGVAVRGAREMVRDGAADELGDRLERLLGVRVPRQDARDGAWYQGYSSERVRSLEPAFDLLWATAEALRGFPPDRLFRGAEALVRERRAEVRDLLEQSMRAGDVIDEVGLGELSAHNSLLDDLLVEQWPPGAVCYGPYDAELRHSCTEPPGPLVPRLVESGVLRDLLEVLDDERLDRLSEALAALMLHRDRVSEREMRFDEPVDHAIAESEVNRSALQRLLHLVHDSNDASFETWLGAIGLTDWRIESLAVFYLQTYCGEATLPSGLDLFLSEFSSSSPSTEEVARFINHDQSGFPVFANPTGREGRELWAYNADTLLAVEASGLQEALEPIVQVFCARGELLLFANILSVLHEHYSTLARYTTRMTETHDFYGVERPAGLRGLERGLAEALLRTRVVEALRRAGLAGTEVTVEGEPIVDELVALVAHLLDPGATVVLRAHAEPERDAIYRYDGLEEAVRPTHANVLYHRAAELSELWDAEDRTVRDELTAISELLSDHFLDLPDETETRAEEAEYLVRMAERGLPVLGAWAEDNLDRGDWRTEMARARLEVDELEGRTDELLAGPVLPALMDLRRLVGEDEQARELVRSLVLHLLSPERSADDPARTAPLAALARVVAALVQLAPVRAALERLARLLGRFLDPVGSPLSGAVSGLARLTGASPDSVALLVLAGSLAAAVPAAEDRPALVVLCEAMAAIGRAEPGRAGPLTSADLATVLGHAVRLLTETRHGLERLYAIVGGRVRDGE